MNKLSHSICKCVCELTPTRTHTRFSPTWLRMANCLITGFCSQLDWVGEANHRAQHVTLAEVKPTLAVAAIQVCCPLSQSPPLSHTEHTLATHSLQFGQGLTIPSAWRQSGEELLHIMIRCWYLGLYIYALSHNLKAFNNVPQLRSCLLSVWRICAHFHVICIVCYSIPSFAFLHFSIHCFHDLIY